MDKILPWHEKAWTTLVGRLQSQSLPHALLLTGPAGIGKLHFATQFAQAVLCHQPAANGTACGGCRACLLVAAGSHPDRLSVMPEEDSKVIKIGQIRALIAALGLKSQLGGYRVAVIAPADRMNTEAANSLLKTLEEPGERTLLMLVSTQPGALPATVRSRCQKLSFSRPPHDIAEQWLRDTAKVEQPAVLLSLAQGAPLAALDMARSEGLARRQQLLADWLSVVGNRASPVEVAEKWQGGNLGECVAWLTGWVMDLIRIRVSGTASVRNADLLEHLQPIAGRVDLVTLYGHLDRVQEAGRLAHTQVSPQAVLEGLLLYWRTAPTGR